MNTTYMYDAADRQTTITDYVSGGSALATYIYSYDKASRVTSEKDAEGTASFTYDNSNELTGVTGSRTESYSYDLNGNRTGTGYSTTVMNETQTSPGVVTYTYDKAGNTISANSGGTFTTYTYDYRNRVTEVTQGRHGGRDVRHITPWLSEIGIQDSERPPTWTGIQRARADALPYSRLQRIGHVADPLCLGAGGR